MPKRHRAIYPLVLAFAVGLGACSDTTAPADAGQLDADQTEADFSALDGLLETEAWESFGVLGELFPIGTGAANLSMSVRGAADLAQSGTTPTGRAFARELMLSMTQLVPRIPLDVRGITFVIDPETLHYVPSDLTGAPETGVRFILYAINPVTHKPIPDSPIGHADLIDLGDDLAQGVSLRFLVVSGDVTHLDYTVTAARAVDIRSLDVSGFVSDGTTRMDFAITVGGTRNTDSTVTEVTFDLAIASRGFSAAATVRTVARGDAESGTVDLELHIGDHVITFVGSSAGGEVDAEVHIDGDLFATISGPERQPVIAGPDGRDLTEREVRALRHILALSDRVFTIFEHLMRPVGHILTFNFR
ncbi:MAG TPA: hypothetical protein VGA37_05675 [Gemmatimonadales bacterium]